MEKFIFFSNHKISSNIKKYFQLNNITHLPIGKIEDFLKIKILKELYLILKLLHMDWQMLFLNTQLIIEISKIPVVFLRHARTVLKLKVL